MPFTSLHLHASLQKGIRDAGYTRPTPIQEEAIPLALAGRDLLACAMTGSGKTAAFLLPIQHHLLGKPRGTTRALVLTPTRELAAQILDDFNTLAVHTPLTAAAVYGGVGMGPQEHAFRTGVDLIVACPGRLLDHMNSPYARLKGLEFLVLDEADRMLDMGFLPDIKRVLAQLPRQRQTLFFSATMPPPIAQLTRELLKDPGLINLQRKAAPAVGITQAIYPVAQDLKGALFLELLRRDIMQEALVFTRTKHRADRLAKFLAQNGIVADRIHGNRSQAQRTATLAAFKAGQTRVLVATDIVARGIDIEELGHVVNFDVPLVPEDYIHRVGRTARAEATGDAFTFVSPEEEGDLRRIEGAVAKRLPRVVLPDFDYSSRPGEKLEVPLAERIAKIRAEKALARQRSREKEERRLQQQAEAEQRTRLKEEERLARNARAAQLAAERQARPAAGRGGGGRGGAPSPKPTHAAGGGSAARSSAPGSASRNEGSSTSRPKRKRRRRPSGGTRSGV
jgi:ATP-dependent RNA helicase RhlE